MESKEQVRAPMLSVNLPKHVMKNVSRCCLHAHILACAVESSVTPDLCSARFMLQCDLEVG